MSKAKKTAVAEDKQDSKSAQQSQSSETQQVTVELLMAHGNCKKGATRSHTLDQANVLVNAGIAKIIES